MPENPVIPPPNVLFGEKPKQAAIPPPDVLFKKPKDVVGDYYFNKPDVTPDEIVNSIPELPGNDASKKDVLKDYIKSKPSTQDISDAILTLQGKHPHQEGGLKFYTNDQGKPVPLKNSERPPAGYDVASLWGNQKEANDDNFFTSLGKHAINGLVGAAEGVVSLADVGQGLVTGSESTALNSLKNSADYLKFKTKAVDDIYQGEGVKDILSPSKYHFNKDNVTENMLQGMESVISFALGTKGLGAATKSVKTAAAISAYGMAANEMTDIADEAGLEGRNKYNFVAATAVPQAALEMLGGAEKLILRNQNARQEISQTLKALVAEIPKDAEGNITKEGLQQLSEGMTTTLKNTVKKFAGQTLKSTAEEAGTEALQEVAQEGSKQLYDKLAADPKFPNADVFSPEALNRYVNAGISGALGAVGPSAYATHQKNRIERDKAQSENIYEQVKKGPEAVKAMIQNVENEKEQGNIGELEAADAITRIKSYEQYNKDVTPMQIPDEGKRELFDLTFQKENLLRKLEIIGDPKETGPIGEGIYNGIEKQAKDLQKKIDEIVLKAQIKDESTVAEKTVEDISKTEQPKKEGETTIKHSPERQALIDKYKSIAKKEDTRTYEEIPVSEFNSNKLSYRDKHSKVVDYLEKQSDKKAVGRIAQREFAYNGKKDKVFGVELPDGRIMRFSSSMKRNEGFRGHFREEQFPDLTDKDLEGLPIAIKSVEVPAFKEGEKPKKAIKAFNTATGKFVGWLKATNTGGNTKNAKPEFSKEQIEGKGGLKDLEMVIEPTESSTTVEEIKPTEPTTPTEPVAPIEEITETPVAETETVNIEEPSLVEAELEPELNQKSAKQNAVVKRVVNLMKKNLPGIEIIYDETLDAAGQLQGNTIKINPYYAGKDTPIHEAAHVLLDAMGDNKVKVAAIEQLKKTDLWKETKERYPELNDKELGNEVLAEAIGREGADIFDTESQRSRFKQLLDYIFNWLKQKLGLDKSIAKSLAKQIIGGIRTKKLKGKSDKVKRQERKRRKSLKEFREKVLGRDVNTIRKDLSELKELLNNEDLAPEDRTAIEDIIRGIQQQFADDKEAYEQAESSVNNLKDLSEKDINSLSLEDLTQAWNNIRDLGEYKSDEFKDVKRRIADKVNRDQTEILKKNPAYKEGKKRDMTWREVWIKTLSDQSHEFPLIQGLSNIYEEKVLEKSTEIKERQKKLEKLAKAVIKERNGKLGSPSDWFTSDSAKYFDYVDNNGKLRTDKTGLSKAQIDFLDYIKELIDEKNANLTDEAVTDEIIKVDKGFQEKWRTEDKMAAVLGLFKADEQENNNYLNYNGKLTSKFNQPREEGRGYSKDFYKAGLSLIEDIAHVKYMNEVVPIVDSVEQFYKDLGLEKDASGRSKGYANTIKFLEEWKNEQLYEKKKVTDPKFDLALRLLRRLTSATVMGFNIPANIMNAAMGNYNAWRKDGLAHWTKGQVRLFGDMKKAMAINEMFDVVENDVNSNPKMSAGNFFTNLAFAGQKWGELQIQLSQFLGYLDEKEYDKLQFNDKGKLEIKGTPAEKKAFKAKMNEYKQNVHNIQGKYSSKDRRNFMRFEAGKAASQFKLWIPDFWKERLGNEFIDRHGNLQRGSFRKAFGLASDELKQQIKEKGAAAIWNDKRVMSNIKGLMTVAFLLIATNQDDDDEKTRKETLSLENALSNMLFIIDPQQSKYILTSPVAGISKVTNLIDAAQAVVEGDERKALKNAKKLIPGNKVLDIPDQVESFTK